MKNLIAPKEILYTTNVHVRDGKQSPVSYILDLRGKIFKLSEHITTQEGKKADIYRYNAVEENGMPIEGLSLEIDRSKSRFKLAYKEVAAEDRYMMFGKKITLIFEKGEGKLMGNFFEDLETIQAKIKSDRANYLSDVYAGMAGH